MKACGGTTAAGTPCRILVAKDSYGCHHHAMQNKIKKVSKRAAAVTKSIGERQCEADRKRLKRSMEVTERKAARALEVVRDKLLSTGRALAACRKSSTAMAKRRLTFSQRKALESRYRAARNPHLGAYDDFTADDKTEKIKRGRKGEGVYDDFTRDDE